MMTMGQMMATAAHAAFCLSLFLGTCGLTAYIVVSTPRRSPLRLGSLPVLGYLSHHLLLGLGTVSESSVFASVYIGNTVIILLQCVNFLLVKAYADADLVAAGIYSTEDAVVTKTWRALVLLFNLRGTGTVWEDRNKHAFPAYCAIDDAAPTRKDKAKTKNGSKTAAVAVDRRCFVTRQLVIFAWQYLFADIAYAMSVDADPEMDDKMFGEGSEYAYASATPEQWAGKLAVGVFGGFGPGRSSIDMWYRALSVAFVSLGLTEAEYWPPLFGSFFADAYTLRRAWSLFWHQLPRWPLSSISNWLARDVLGLQRSTYIERVVNTGLAFLCSGLMHVVIDLYRGMTLAESPSLPFFTASAGGIMLEDLAMMLWRRLAAGAGGPAKTPIWQKAVGFAWVLFWLMVTAPWFVFPQARMPVENRWPVPVGVSEYIGLPAAGGMLVLGGIGIKYRFGGEI